MTDDIREKVARGVELLDRLNPRWETRIEPSELDMSQCRHCILGQLYGDYFDGLERLDIPLGTGRSFEYGFNESDYYAELREAWLSVIFARRQPQTPAETSHDH